MKTAPDVEKRILEELAGANQMVALRDRRALSRLKALRRDALETKDPGLIGRVFYSHALAAYFFGSYDKLCGYLYNAIRYLLRSDEHLTLARAYNLFAVHAQHSGVYDVAYDYFLMAYSVTSGKGDELEHAVIDANLGDLLGEMGDYRKACIRSKRSIPVVLQHTEGAALLENGIIVMVNYGLCSLYAGDTATAHRMRNRVEKQLKKIEGQVSDRPALWYLLLCAQIALADGERVRMQVLLDEIITRVVMGDSFALFTKDIHSFCRALITAGEWTSAQHLLDAVAQNEASNATYFSRLLLVQLQIDFYKARNLRARLDEAYAARRTLTRLLEKEQKLIYRESVRLMSLVDELAREQEKKRAENRRLQAEAETDALTGIPNRTALNRVLGESFARAKEKGLPFGTGVVDIDDFKRYNDRYGHSRGDECLIETASALHAAASREGIFCARYGGDEFVLVYDDMSREEILSFEKRMLAACPVPVTHGFTVRRLNPEDKVWDSLSAADASLYRKKSRKKR